MITTSGQSASGIEMVFQGIAAKFVMAFLLVLRILKMRLSVTRLQCLINTQYYLKTRFLLFIKIFLGDCENGSLIMFENYLQYYLTVDHTGIILDNLTISNSKFFDRGFLAIKIFFQVYENTTYLFINSHDSSKTGIERRVTRK